MFFTSSHIIPERVVQDFLDRGLLLKREATEPNGSVIKNVLHCRFFSFFLIQRDP